MKPLVCLDIDGVLNSSQWFKYCHKHGLGNKWPEMHLDPKLCRMLQGFLRSNGANLLITSTWRLMMSPEEMVKVLGAKRLTAPIVGFTPELKFDLMDEDQEELQYDSGRGLEIQWWLQTHAPDNWQEIPLVILDDDQDIGCLRPRWVRINRERGLTRADLRTARWFMDRPLGVWPWEHNALQFPLRKKSWAKAGSSFVPSE